MKHAKKKTPVAPW